MPVSANYRPAPRIEALGKGFFDRVHAAAFPTRVLRFRNQAWADRIGLGELDASEWERHFARFEPLPDNLAQPLALRYHGHQFGVYNPNLGDGRGFLFAQLEDDRGRLLDLATKGSGQTPWSRSGDGRLTLKGGVREVLATEMLEALGVNTSKTLSLFETGEKLQRGDEPSPTRSSVLVRLGHSHVRFGSFQRFAHLADPPRLQALFDYAVEHYCPDLPPEKDGTVVAFAREVTRRTAELAASWMVAGFVHGVLNTDNLNITGESFDYGPYRFLPHYAPAFVAAYFDETGLYAFGQQPRAVVWALTRLCDALRPLSPTTPFAPALRVFEPTFKAAMARRFCARLGIEQTEPDVDHALIDAAYSFLEESKVGYDQFFFDWRGGAAAAPRARSSPESGLYRGDRFEAMMRLLEVHSAAVDPAAGDAANGPETLLIGEVERVWARIAEDDDWSAFDEKIDRIRAFARAE